MKTTATADPASDAGQVREELAAALASLTRAVQGLRAEIEAARFPGGVDSPLLTNGVRPSN